MTAYLSIITGIKGDGVQVHPKVESINRSEQLKIEE